MNHKIQVETDAVKDYIVEAEHIAEMHDEMTKCDAVLEQVRFGKLPNFLIEYVL